MLYRMVCIVPVLYCMYEYTHHSTGQVGQRRGHFLGKDDSCDSTLAIYQTSSSDPDPFR